MSNVLEDVIRAYTASLIQREHIKNQNGANLVNLHGLDMANKLGINASDANHRLGISPFPGTTTATNIETGKSSPWWATAALVGLSSLGGAGATALASHFLKSEPDTPPAAVQPADSTFGKVDIDVS